MLYRDVVTLDSSIARGDQFEAEFLDYLDLSEKDNLTEEERKRFLEIRDNIIMENVRNFFLTYPAWSWIMVRTDSGIRPYALIAEKDFPGGISCLVYP
jgi:hypothetical protein